MATPHPLEQLRAVEIDNAREFIIAQFPSCMIRFRSIHLEEPAKAELIEFLIAEHDGTLGESTSRPPRLARAQYDVVDANKKREYVESVVDVQSKKEVSRETIDASVQAALTVDEIIRFYELCMASPVFQEAVAKFKLPDGFEIEMDPWPYGGLEPEETAPRYVHGLCFAKDTRSKNPDTNYYPYPIPIVPVMDMATEEIVRIDKLATGGTEDGMAYNTHSPNVIDHCVAGEYVPELMRDVTFRTDIKSLNIIQPDGQSFKVSDDNLVEWQKWRFRVGFNPREGTTIHDVRYDGRSVFYRLALSEMTVPYGDPRPPFNRKQAFDLGDGGAGRLANNLSLGCDCLGAIRYLDSISTGSDGKPTVSKNVVCIHEQDNGIGWKHTNFRTNRAIVTRYRELIIQSVITAGNYEYVFAYKFDQAGGISFEVRATGVLSVVNIDPGKTSPWGNVVAPGVLGQNHQHIFCLRVDPAVDGYNNTVFVEESLPLPMNPETNPFGNGYKVASRPVEKSSALDASPSTNLNIKMSNTDKLNPISGKPVSYKFTPPATQLLLADPASTMARRASFARHHLWVTSYRDGELFAAGTYTYQSHREKGGVTEAAARNDDTTNTDVVLWSVFGLTHNPRVEDWPVMPIEKIELNFRPADFFDCNPAMDVPATVNAASVLVNGNASCCQVPN